MTPKLPLEALYDWTRMTDALAAGRRGERPTQSGYHAMTFGYPRRRGRATVAGRSLGAFFREEVAGRSAPTSTSAYRRARTRASRDGGAGAWRAAIGALDPETIAGRVLTNPPLRPEAANRPEWRRAEIPAANGHGNARSVAQVLGVLACGGARNGVRFLREETLRDAIVEQYYGKDLVLGRRFRWGSGFMLTSDVLPLGPNPHVFGHGGWGGSLGFADLDARVSWAYIMNKMSPARPATSASPACSRTLLSL